MKKCEIDVMVILETKLGMPRLEWVVQISEAWCKLIIFLVIELAIFLFCEFPWKSNWTFWRICHNFFYCNATCKVTLLTFLVIFVYAFPTIVSRRPLWSNIMELSLNCSLPWLIMRDFNNVLKCDEKRNGANVILYEVKDFENCCLNVGLKIHREILHLE